MKKTILFISHDATRTGAPIMFLHFIKWIKENTEANIIILLKKGGVMKAEFEKLGPTYLYFKPYKKGLLGKIGKSFQSRNNSFRIKSRIKNAQIDLIYSNTITNGFLYEVLGELNKPVISHIHELERVIKNFSANNLEYIKKYTSHYIAASQAVKDNLVNNHQIEDSKISVCHEFIPTDKFTSDSSYNRQQIHHDLGIKHEDAFVVGGSGRFDLRKGADIFMHVLKQIAKRDASKKIYFMWVGAEHNGDMYNWLNDDAEKAGLSDRLIIIPPVDDPRKFFFSMDVFLMTSREDPFPLVCLESAAMGKPVICFERGGGMPEFVENDAGFVIPYFDVEAMADAILKLSTDQQLLLQLGESAALKVRNRHNVNKVAPELYEKVQNIINRS